MVKDHLQMQADIHTLFESDFYRILDFRCHCTEHGISAAEYSSTFAISFVRKGNFLFNVFRHSLDSYTGCVLVTKPGYEHTVTHGHAIPDECTIIEFKDYFYQESVLDLGDHIAFFKNNDLHSTLVRTNARMEFLHYSLLRTLITHPAHRLQIDHQVLEIFNNTMSRITDYYPDERIHTKLKGHHLSTIEQAKAYINDHFSEDLSLHDLALHCHVSPFHLARLFKLFTSYAPHRFLMETRLQHAQQLLFDTTLPVADVAFSSGFNSVEHFTAAFKKSYGIPPATFRNQPASFSK